MKEKGKKQTYVCPHLSKLVLLLLWEIMALSIIEFFLLDAGGKVERNCWPRFIEKPQLAITKDNKTH